MTNIIATIVGLAWFVFHLRTVGAYPPLASAGFVFWLPVILSAATGGAGLAFVIQGRARYWVWVGLAAGSAFLPFQVDDPSYALLILPIYCLPALLFPRTPWTAPALWRGVSFAVAIGGSVLQLAAPVLLFGDSGWSWLACWLAGVPLAILVIQFGDRFGHLFALIKSRGALGACVLLFVLAWALGPQLGMTILWMLVWQIALLVGIILLGDAILRAGLRPFDYLIVALGFSWGPYKKLESIGREHARAQQRRSDNPVQ